MKKFYYVILLIAGTVNAQNIAFSGTFFKNLLLSSSSGNSIAKDVNDDNIQIDANSNGEITYAEAAVVYELKLENEDIPNVVGLEHFVNLREARLKGNEYQTIDVSNLIYLTDLDVRDNNFLASIYAKNGIVENIDFNNNNPNLIYICADENQVAALNDSNSGSLPNYLVNSYCTITPGGNYNSLTGQIEYDSDNNSGTINTINPYLKLATTIGGNTIQTVSKNTGIYNLYNKQTGAYNLTPQMENPAWFTFTPATGTFANTNNNIGTSNFFLVPNGIHNDVEISLRPINEPVGGIVGTPIPYEIVFKNKGTQPHSGSLSMNYDPLLLAYQSATVPVNLGAGSVTHLYNNLLPFETRSFVITLSSNNALAVGSTLQSSLSIDAGGETVSTQNDNNFTYNQLVVNANNPNNIECLEGNSVSNSQIGNYLHYAINFKNLGNQTAENITIKTVLDPAKFNVSSIQILNATHTLDLEVINNVAYYKLKNAGIGGPGGQGGILLKMATNSNLASGSTVVFGAEIFFDYGTIYTPVLETTNGEATTFSSLSNSIITSDNGIIIYPNPSADMVYISSSKNEIIRTVELYDTFGRLLQANIVNTNNPAVDISQRSVGIYYLKIYTDSGQKVEQIMKK